MSKQRIDEIIWKDWEIVSVLGKGSYGVVYKAKRSDFNSEIYAAVKHLSIPNDKSDVESLKADGMSDSDIDRYYKDIVDNISKEIMLMETLKGTTNIVNIEDFEIEKRDNEVGWDILIRMELLNDLNDYFKGKSGPITDLLKVGIDLCTALEFCYRDGIIHRDIKPENIFVNKYDDFKLGDFGIARQYQANLNMSMRGTPFYAAPEMFEGGQYDHTADIYSLGLVLYRLFNANKLPFFPTDGAASFAQRNEAIRRRLAGEALPAPINSTPKLTKVLSKACARNPRQRYQTPTEFKNAFSLVGTAAKAGWSDMFNLKMGEWKNLKETLGEYSLKTGSKTAAVAKWAGTALTFAGSFVDNYNEYGGDLSNGNIYLETVLETAVSTGLQFAVGAGVTAVAGPVVGKWASVICGVVDSKLGISDKVSKGIIKAGKAIGDGFKQAKKSVASWFKW